MRRFAFLSVLLLVAWGCDSGPSGPGEYVGTVQGNVAPLGGAVLEVVGKGITGFSASGSTRAYSAPVSGALDTYRVLLVSETPGTLQFKVAVADLGAGKVTGTVVNLASGENLTLPVTSDYKVSFAR